MSSFSAPTGTRDVLAPESARVESLVARFAVEAHASGYGLLLSPMFEDVGVFRRGVGEESEVVTKEMYEFEDKGGRHLALRPEGTASVVRAFVQHRPQIPWKVWYATPAFRYERPQKGRFRQHHQLGVEALGSEDADLDVEVIALLARYYASIGLTQVDLRINSMGDEQCLPGYRDALSAFLAEHEAELCSEHQATWKKNPLRVLDCKRPGCVALREQAPRISDALCGPCREHFERVRSGLDALGVGYRLDDFLVRGLDYYVRTTFEFSSEALDAAQNALGGGGRYDGLAAALGGPETPGVGFATGVERILLAAESEGLELGDQAISAFVIDLTGGHSATLIADRLRQAGVATDRGFDHRSLKAQLRQADRLGARVAVIVGEAELAAGEATVRVLAGDGAGSQERVEIDRVVERVKELVS